MDLIFNELSIHPLATDKTTAYERIVQFLKTAKAAQSHTPAFNRIRFEQEYADILLAEDYSLQQWLHESNDRNIATLLRGMTRRPFIDRKDEDKEEQYLLYRYYYVSSTGEKTECQGLAVAYIYDTLSISFAGNREFELTKLVLSISGESDEKISVTICNVSSPDDFDPTFIDDCLHNRLQIEKINSIVDIEQAFPVYSFTEEAFEHILEWKIRHKGVFERLIRLLLPDIKRNPFTGGLGKTEVLSREKGMCSKRLTDADRITYSLKNDAIHILSCKGHYDDR